MGGIGKDWMEREGWEGLVGIKWGGVVGIDRDGYSERLDGCEKGSDGRRGIDGN